MRVASSPTRRWSRCVSRGNHGNPLRRAVAHARARAPCAPVPAASRAHRVHKRRLRLSSQIEALIAHCARQSPRFFSDLLLVDSTAVEWSAHASVETVKRGGASSLTDALANAYDSCARGRMRVDTTLLEADIRSPTGS